MAETVLITGGAGFIGRWTAQALLRRGYEVRILDSLIEQAHPGSKPPADLPPEAELIVGDVRDANAVLAALRGVDKVIHLAAEVGVGQSMYAVDRYTSVNDYGAAVLFQQLIARPVQAGGRPPRPCRSTARASTATPTAGCTRPSPSPSSPRPAPGTRWTTRAGR